MKKGQQIAKASLSSLGITSVFGLLIGGEYQYQKWRMSEIEKIDANAKEFLLNGVLKLKNPASNVLKRKQQIWEIIYVIYVSNVTWGGGGGFNPLATGG